MSAPSTTAVRAGAFAAVALLVLGYYSWNTQAPEGSWGIEGDGLGQPAALALLRPGYDGGSAYGRLRVCAPPGQEDAGLPTLPPGFDLLGAEEPATAPCDGGMFTLWLVGEPGSWACACSSGSGCTWSADGGAAPVGRTLLRGEWSGAGCVGKPCSTRLEKDDAGETVDRTWPAACPGAAP